MDVHMEEYTEGGRGFGISKKGGSIGTEREEGGGRGCILVEGRTWRKGRKAQKKRDGKKGEVYGRIPKRGYGNCEICGLATPPPPPRYMLSFMYGFFMRQEKKKKTRPCGRL